MEVVQSPYYIYLDDGFPENKMPQAYLLRVQSPPICDQEKCAYIRQQSSLYLWPILHILQSSLTQSLFVSEWTLTKYLKEEI